MKVGMLIAEVPMKKPKQQVHPAAKKRGADADVPPKSSRKMAANKEERKLEQGLEESMAGSDPPSITQPHPKSGVAPARDRTKSRIL